MSNRDFTWLVEQNLVQTSQLNVVTFTIAMNLDIEINFRTSFESLTVRQLSNMYLMPSALIRKAKVFCYFRLSKATR